jgi:uncharacterized membrane protein
MPEIGPFHPQIVHFVVAFGLLGVALRLISLTGKLAWTRPAATVLLLLTAAAAFAAVQTGHAAHGPVERVPGVGEAVNEHEEAGELVRNLFLVIAAIEIVALALRKRERVAKGLIYLSAIVGLGAAYAVYRAGDLGGDLVYSYAGGIGIRSGDPADVQRLLVAGLYHGARAAREAGRPEEAQRLTEELARQRPDDPVVGLISVESIIRDRHDPAAALTALNALNIPEDNPRLGIQKGILQAEALAATGQRDSAKAVLEDLKKRYPRAERLLTSALDKLQ